MTYPQVHTLPVHLLTKWGLSIDTIHSFPFLVQDVYIPYYYPIHRHDFLEFFLVVRGEGYQVINGKQYPLEPGSCTFLLPYQIHEIFVNSKEPLQLYNCMFGMEILFPASDYGPGLNELLLNKDDLPPSLHLEHADNERIQTIMKDMLGEFRTQSPLRNHLLRHLLSVVLIHFHRLRLKYVQTSQFELHQINKSIWPVVQYIYSHYREPLSLAEVARHFEMNHTNLSSEFKKQLGVNFVHFLQEVRIRHACALLSSTDLNGIDIAIEVGFDSFRSFTRVFRDLKGVTPRQYQNKYQSSG